MRRSLRIQGNGAETPSACVTLYYNHMNPKFSLIDNELWQWREWFIALAHDAFWVLTPTPREFGPFDSYEQALEKVEELWA